MIKKLFSACLSSTLTTVLQVLAFGQDFPVQLPEKILHLPPAAGRSCSIMITGESSKLVESIRANKPEEFKQLLADGDDLNALDHDYETPLMAAIAYDKIEFVKALVEAGADVNKANSLSWTPLIWTAVRNRADIAPILLAAGANVDDENNDGSTALLIAARDSSLELVEMLLKAGANLHHKDKQGRTAFLLSAEGGKAETMEKMLSLGFDPNSSSESRGVALVAAAQYPEMLKTLIKAGAKVNLQDPTPGGLKTMTALEVAAQNGWTASVRVLLEAGADPNLYSSGRLPLDKAIQSKHVEIIELLKKAGAKRWEEIHKADD